MDGSKEKKERKKMEDSIWNYYTANVSFFRGILSSFSARVEKSRLWRRRDLKTGSLLM